ncbi:SLATT domain-containing protein [Streptomyces sp. 5-8]|uniref:SLATT domain-containing protein n=1 Tax=Streptomyces musisoli TaxID=2802280 RepID=A0ABS1NU92_9ACTN|nr:SLATT domain-containing protein [Streptomyces musisoli]MBY8839716.1 SLATT domain-containing protein [Streptomyces sp. SP2-10]
MIRAKGPGSRRASRCGRLGYPRLLAYGAEEGELTGSTPTPRPRDGKARKRDLRGRAFPVLVARTPAERLEAVEALRAWAEQEAEDAIEWYLADKRLKRLGSRYVRGLMILLATTGTVVPLAGAALDTQIQGWGYVFLAAAAGCKGFDHFFGLSTAWMRDITAAQALRGELNEFRLAWTAELLREATGEPEQAVIERRMLLVGGLVARIRARLESETSDWTHEFRAGLQQLQEQTVALPAPREAGAAAQR